jgi:hypothetical protein
MLNFFPLPNNPTLPPASQIINNFFSQTSAAHPRRNDVLRIDVNATAKLSGYFRYINDHDDMATLYSGIGWAPSDNAGRVSESGSPLPAMTNIDHPNRPGFPSVTLRRVNLTRRSRNQTGKSVTMPEWASNY